MQQNLYFVLDVGEKERNIMVVKSEFSHSENILHVSLSHFLWGRWGLRYWTIHMVGSGPQNQVPPELSRTENVISRGEEADRTTITPIC